MLVRHAPAARRDSGEWPDDDLRSLTTKGRKAFARAAMGVAAAAPETSLVLTSPTLRTRDTAALLAAALGLPWRKVRAVPFLHHAVPPRAALAGLVALELPPDFALVGHEPNLGELASLLVAG
ncbi:MAG TPA: histidine phosphatase family protein, partial [Fibrobacteria bacterium]|nr:histidine phosphatase family protein [Fibrobacteria bacterium]